MAINEKTKKVLNIIKSVLVWTILAVSVSMMIFTLISVNTFDKTDRNIFGYKFFIVQSDSMKATDFAAGDVIIVREVDPKTLKADDIITFISPDPADESQKESGKLWYVVSHKIREVTEDDDGLAFRTYGTTTGEDDKTLVSEENVLGKYEIGIPKLGHFFAFMRTTPGYIVCILVPFLLLIISQAVNCIRLFKQYRAEQMAELKEEREKLDAEREETRRMMEELLELKAQMQKNEDQPIADDDKEQKESPVGGAE